MANPKFVKVGNTYTDVNFLMGRTLDSGQYYEPTQIITKSGANKVHVLDMGTSERYLEVNFKGVTHTIYTQLVNFLKDDTVRWSGKTFTFTDENSVDYEVRWWGERLAEKPLKDQTYSEFNILLRVET